MMSQQNTSVLILPMNSACRCGPTIWAWLSSGTGAPAGSSSMASTGLCRDIKPAKAPPQTENHRRRSCSPGPDRRRSQRGAQGSASSDCDPRSSIREPSSNWSDRRGRIGSFADLPAPTECPTLVSEAVMTIFERASVCTLDCPDTCSLTVEVAGDRIVKVRGSDALPYTEGIICNKVARYSAEFVHGASRLHWPLRRVGLRGSGRFERIGWDEALDEIHQRVTAVVVRFGPQAVMALNYSGPHGLLSMDSMSLC